MKSNKQKALLLNYTGRNGAGPLVSYQLAKALSENGEKVVAVISAECSNIKYWKQLQLEKLIVIDTYNNKQEFLLHTLCFFLYKRWQILWKLRQYEIEFILCPMIAFWTYMINKMFYKTPVCIINHDPQPHSGDKSTALLNFFGMQKVYRSAKIIFVHSKCFINYVEETYDKKGQVFYIPLGRQVFQSDLKSKSSSLQYSGDKINFLFFGRIEKYKGLDILAEAYQKVSKICENVTLTVAGAGSFKEYSSLYNRLTNVTVINRWIGDSEIGSFFCGPNVILVAPYVDATQSGPLLIALEYNVPVIATDIGGLSEQVIEGKTGLLVKAGDKNSLADAMVRLAQDKPLIKELSLGTKAKLRELEWDSIGKRLCKHMRSAMISQEAFL